MKVLYSILICAVLLWVSGLVWALKETDAYFYTEEKISIIFGILLFSYLAVKRIKKIYITVVLFCLGYAFCFYGIPSFGEAFMSIFGKWTALLIGILIKGSFELIIICIIYFCLWSINKFINDHTQRGVSL
ncbi:MAG: hypothetical protein V4439_01140 [Patescibacteria group bacterium]